MKKTAVLFLIFAAFVFTAGAQTKIQGLLTEAQVTPIGIDDAKPHFTWQMWSGKRGVSQSAYQIVVTDSQKQVVWDSKKLPSGEALNIAYDGAALHPATRYLWKVTVWDQSGKQFAGESWFETGLMNPDPNLSAWEGATWIGGA